VAALVVEEEVAEAVRQPLEPERVEHRVLRLHKR